MRPALTRLSRHPAGTGRPSSPTKSYRCARRGFSFEPLGNPDEVCERCTEVLPRGRKGVPDRRWRRRLPPPFDDALSFEPAKTSGQHLRRDAFEVCPQFREATLVFPEIPDHVRRPCTAEQPHAVFQRALGRRRQHPGLAAFDHETKLPDGNPILEGRWRNAGSYTVEIHLYNHEQQT